MPHGVDIPVCLSRFFIPTTSLPHFHRNQTSPHNVEAGKHNFYAQSCIFHIPHTQATHTHYTTNYSHLTDTVTEPYLPVLGSILYLPGSRVIDETPNFLLTSWGKVTSSPFSAKKYPLESTSSAKGFLKIRRTLDSSSNNCTCAIDISVNL